MSLSVWQILLLVWIVVIPASVAVVASLAARRRTIETSDDVRGVDERPAQLLHLARHARYAGYRRSPRVVQPGSFAVRERGQLRDRAR